MASMAQSRTDCSMAKHKACSALLSLSAALSRCSYRGYDLPALWLVLRLPDFNYFFSPFLSCPSAYPAVAHAAVPSCASFCLATGTHIFPFSLCIFPFHASWHHPVRQPINTIHTAPASTEAALVGVSPSSSSTNSVDGAGCCDGAAQSQVLRASNNSAQVL